MFANKQQKKMIKTTIIGCIVLIGLLNIPIIESRPDSFFTILASFAETTQNKDQICILQRQLKEIGINLELGHLCFAGCIGTNYMQGHFDIGITNLNTRKILSEFSFWSSYFRGGYPDFSEIYREYGVENFAGYRTSMDYDKDLLTGKNEWYINEFHKIFPFNSEERVQHYWEWQNYLMNDILPCYPLSAIKSNTYFWDELNGYNETKGLIQSWNDMYWSDLHEGQDDTNELVMIKNYWNNLNPINQSDYDSSSAFVNNLVLEPLIWFDQDQTIYPHLATDFTFLNDTHLRIQLRNNIKWQNDTDNIFANEYFDSKDVYFTYYVMKNLSRYKRNYQWIKDMKIINQTTLDIFIDDDSDTPENDSNANIVYFLGDYILPEHYLNQTQLADGITPDCNHISWKKFKSHCFGTGRFQIESIQTGYKTTFNIFEDCWHLNETITIDPLLDWTNRFSSQPAALEKLVIDSYNYEVEEITAFQNGEADLIQKPTWKDFTNDLIESVDYDFQKNTYHSLRMFIFNLRESRGTMMNSMEPCPGNASITKGLAVRKAISFAINADELNEFTFSDINVRTHYPIHERMGIWCNPNIIKYDYNLEKAKDYMRIAGFTYPEDTTNIGITIPTNLLLILTGTVIILTIRNYRKKKWAI